MRRGDEKWARDIVDAVVAVRAHRAAHQELDARSRERSAHMYVDALTYQLMAIGEACKNLTADVGGFAPVPNHRGFHGASACRATVVHR